MIGGAKGRRRPSGAPPPFHRFFDGLRPTLHIAHRGGAALAPENTLAAFRLALERYRTDMLELDVHLSRDGQVVVSHDATLERCTEAEGPIAEHSWAELERLDAGYRFTPDGRRFPFRGQGVRIPRLEEVLRALPRVPLNLELKTEATGAPDVLAELLRREGALARVLCGSEHDRVAAELLRALPDSAHYYPRDALAQWVLAVKSQAAVPRDARFCALDLPLSYGEARVVDAPLLAAARAMGLWVNVWTVDDAPTMRDLVELGVGGIMTDRPDLLRSVLDEQAAGRV